MTETTSPQYCPTDWLDEMCPLSDTPEAFARRVGDKWLLIDPDEDDDAETSFSQDLEPGQVVNFGRLTTYDDIELTVREDGTYHAQLPAFDGDPGLRLQSWDDDDVVDELAEVVRLGVQGNGFDNPLGAGTYTVECWAWRETIRFRFEPDGEEAKFVLCAGAN